MLSSAASSAADIDIVGGDSLIQQAATAAQSPRLLPTAGIGRNRRSQSVTADTIRAGLRRMPQQQQQLQSTQQQLFLLPGAADSTILEEGATTNSVLRPLMTSQRSPRDQQQLQLQRRRSSIVAMSGAAATGLQPAKSREFVPPSTADQLLRAIQSVEVFETQDEWTLVTRPNGATFWLSKRTGQFKPHAPNTVYRNQAMEIRRLQDRISQLELELSAARAQEQSMQTPSEDLQAALEEKDALLLRLGHSVEKLKSELGQKDELVKQRDAELTRRSKEIQKLSEKIQRVDALTAELLEVQEQKKQTELQLREKDFELSQIARRLQAAEVEKEEASSAARSMRERSENLKEQVRIEIERVAALEERLRDSEKAVEAQARLQAEVKRLSGSAKDADFLVASSRRCQRQLADQLAGVKVELEHLRAWQAQALKDAETRDTVMQREVAEALESCERHRRAACGLRALLAELRCQFPPAGAWIDAYFASGGGGVSGGGALLRRRHSGRLLNARPSSSAAQVVRPSAGSIDRIGGGNITAEEAEVDKPEADDASSDRTLASAEKFVGEECQSKTMEGPTGTSITEVSTNGSVEAHGSGISGNYDSRKLRDRVASLFIHLGDRVTVRLPETVNSEGVERVVEAVVKYIGQSPTTATSAAGTRRSGGIRYGVKLLDKKAAAAVAAAVAATTTKAVEANTAAQNRFDLLVPAKQIEFVYNQKTNAFRKLGVLIEDYLEMNRRS